MDKFKVGEKVGSLLFIREVPRTTSRRRALFQCKCGGLKECDIVQAKMGRIASCGCLLSESHIKHGAALGGKVTTEYKIWRGIKERCLNTNNIGYVNYGGRGIKICERWVNSFESFLADMGCRPSRQHSIDRINNDGDYEHLNCRWATSADQQNNKRTNKFIVFQGRKLTIAQWAGLLKMNKDVLGSRLKKWGIEKSLTTPLRNKKPNRVGNNPLLGNHPTLELVEG